MKNQKSPLFNLFLPIIILGMVQIHPSPAQISGKATSAADRMQAWVKHVRMAENSPFRNLQWRVVGPSFQGGRIESIACRPDNPSTIYMGVGASNLWRSTNNGILWEPIFDHESTFSIGAVAVSPSHPEIVWVGTGEVLMARSSYSGTGVFKSTDGGNSWENMGLHESHHVARVLIHPNNPEVVYVAVLGHLYSLNEERGLYRSCNGGKTWEKILYISARVGCAEVMMDPEDSNTLYSVMWERDRHAWNHTPYGPGSGLYKSTDGGESWIRLKGGLPEGDLGGRIGIDIARSNPNILYALVDSHENAPGSRKRIGGEVYRSDNRGETWRRVNQKQLMTAIGYDFCLIRVSPDDENQIYVLGNYLLSSRDGGKTYERNHGIIVHLRPHESDVLHLDHHDMWIDPENPDRILLGTDGGLYMSYDRGETWLHCNNQPLAEVYAVTVDMADPYNIYIGTQDNAALFGHSTDTLSAVRSSSWKHVYLDPWGGGDSYFTWVDPADPNTIYYEHQFGELRRKNMATGKTESIRPKMEEGNPRLRRNWMTPFFISHYDPSILYYAAEKVFKSTDRGDHWTCISPYLTSRPGPEKQGNVPYGTITSLSESPLRSGLLAAGTDDGKVQVTRDDGGHWTDVSAGLPEKWVSRILVSRHHDNRIYVSLTGYREDDFTPYLYVSNKMGREWHSITSNLPLESINVIREDPRDSSILYVGTDLGVYVTLNGGKEWHSLCSDLPTTPVHDLVIHPRELELVIGTHGRGVFVLNVESIPEYHQKFNDGD